MIRRNSPGGIALLVALALLLGACSDDDETALSLPAPQNVTATVEDFTATVTWDNAAGATAYNLYRAPTSAVDPAAATKFAAVVPPYTDTGLAPNTIYYYAATAVYPEGESGISASAEAKCPPPAPSITSAVPGDGQVTVSWTDVEGADSYSLYWDTAPVVSTADEEIPVASGTSYVHTGLTNGTTCYYVVTAVSATTGESALSAEVSAKPQAPPADAPVNVSAVPTPETTRSVTITWQPPSNWTPASYHIYWDNAAGIDYADRLIDGAISPHVQTGLIGMTTYYYRVAGVDGFGNVGQLSYEVSATPKGPPLPVGGGGDTGFGNNLSFPLIFADGIGITNQPIAGTWVQALDPYDSGQIDFNTGLRPLSTEILPVFPYFNPLDNYVLNSVVYYMQQTSSTWQAEWIVPSPGVVTEVTAKWGDNLLSKPLSANSVIRVETTLEAAVNDLVAYTMQSLYGTKEGEMTGTDGTMYSSPIARVFAADARLRIEKLSPTACVLVDTGLFSGDGQGVFGAEVSVGGTLAYGYNWMINSMDLTACGGAVGRWKLTFSLSDPPVNTEITAAGNGTLDTESNSVSVEVDIQ